MAVAKFTDLAIRAFSKGVYFDEKTPGFGILIGKRQKTWLVVRGHGRVRTALGHYPEMSLSDARKQALVAIGTGYVPHPRSASKRPAQSFRETRGHPAPGSKAETQRSCSDIFTGRSPSTRSHTRMSWRQSKTWKNRASCACNQALRSFFNWCIPRYLSSNPCVGIKQPRQRSRERVLSDDELRRIWKRADEIGYPMEQITKLLILTGQRRSEISILDGSGSPTPSPSPPTSPRTAGRAPYRSERWHGKSYTPFPRMGIYCSQREESPTKGIEVLERESTSSTSAALQIGHFTTAGGHSRPTWQNSECVSK